MAPSDPLAELEAAGADLGAIRRARAKSEEVSATIGGILASIEFDSDSALVAVGSLGRREFTSGSDFDFVLVSIGDDPPPIEVQGARADAISQVLEAVKTAGFPTPNVAGPIGEAVRVVELVEKIGSDPDTNFNLTQRLLLLLESRPIVSDALWATAVERIHETYLQLKALKPNRPPRFLLNDVIRYWRTICVDYEGKMRARGMEGWALRNAKLRTVRKMLFASGLLPLLECQDYDVAEIHAFLDDQLALSPVERVALSFLRHGMTAEGAAALTSYSTFLNLLDDEARRDELDQLGESEEERQASETWQHAKDLGSGFEAGLLSLLFDSDLAKMTRSYAIF